jgi:hypothetical protein
MCISVHHMHTTGRHLLLVLTFALVLAYMLLVLVCLILVLIFVVRSSYAYCGLEKRPASSHIRTFVPLMYITTPCYLGILLVPVCMLLTLLYVGLLLLI